jgi:hypothetical protein
MYVVLLDQRVISQSAFVNGLRVTIGAMIEGACLLPCRDFLTSLPTIADAPLEALVDKK